MKRKEEINIAAKNKYPYIKELPQSYSHQAIFIEGAEWADRTMLDRACEWLGNRHNIEKCLGVLTSRTEDLSKAFRQAMKGGAE